MCWCGSRWSGWRRLSPSPAKNSCIYWNVDHSHSDFDKSSALWFHHTFLVEMVLKRLQNSTSTHTHTLLLIVSPKNELPNVPRPLLFWYSFTKWSAKQLAGWIGSTMFVDCFVDAAAQGSSVNTRDCLGRCGFEISCLLVFVCATNVKS